MNLTKLTRDYDAVQRLGEVVADMIKRIDNDRAMKHLSNFYLHLNGDVDAIGATITRTIQRDSRKRAASAMSNSDGSSSAEEKDANEENTDAEVSATIVEEESSEEEEISEESSEEESSEASADEESIVASQYDHMKDLPPHIRTTRGCSVCRCLGHIARSWMCPRRKMTPKETSNFEGWYALYDPAGLCNTVRTSRGSVRSAQGRSTTFKMREFPTHTAAIAFATTGK